MTTPETPPDPRIVLIDDEEDSFALMRHLLKRIGASEPVEWFKDGESAVRHLQLLARVNRPLPMLAVVDLKMPGMTGFDVLRAIRATPQLSRLFTVVMTSSSLPEDIGRALQLGAFCYFEKYPLPEKFSRVYELARGRLSAPAHVPDPCETALRRIIALLEDAISVAHDNDAAASYADQSLIDTLRAIRRNATQRLLARVNPSVTRGPVVV